ARTEHTAPIQTSTATNRVLRMTNGECGQVRGEAAQSILAAVRTQLIRVALDRLPENIPALPAHDRQNRPERQTLQSRPIPSRVATTNVIRKNQRAPAGS